MNRTEVILTIKEVGCDFSRVMACLNEPQYVDGYRQALKDIEKLFYYAGLDADYAAERNELNETIQRLQRSNRELRKTIHRQSKMLQELVLRTDVYEALSEELGGKRQEAR